MGLWQVAFISLSDEADLILAGGWSRCRRQAFRSRTDTTPESLAKLRPVFDPQGILTAGNSSQISDGAAALLIAGDDALKKYNLQPIARIVGSAWTGVESWRLAEAPVPAVKKLLEKLDKTVDDSDLVENNEAFAVHSVIAQKLLGVSFDRLNIYGGAIALGHPIDCSGARIMVTLLNALAERDGKLGLASLCHGTGSHGGDGGASLILA